MFFTIVQCLAVQWECVKMNPTFCLPEVKVLKMWCCTCHILKFSEVVTICFAWKPGMFCLDPVCVSMLASHWEESPGSAVQVSAPRELCD